MQTLNKVNPSAITVLDLRRGDNTRFGRSCLTPWGQFRSVACAADHIMAREGEVSADFIANAAMSVGSLKDMQRYGWTKATLKAHILEKAKRNLYQSIYKRCEVGSETNNGQFRFTN